MISAEVVEGLVTAFLKKNFDKPADTPDFHREMWRMCCSDYKFVAIAAPRRFAKSTAITHSYVLANLLFRERSFILLVADTETQSSFFLEDIKKELTSNEDLIAIFGIKGLSKDTVTDLIIDFEDGHQARVMAKGSGQKLRGVKWDNRRPDLIVCDDLENDELVLNKERRENFRRWFRGALIPALSKYGIIRVVGTILHTDSQLNRLMPRMTLKDKPPYVDDLREIAHPSAIWHSARYRAHDKAMTKSLWPENMDVEWLTKERQGFIDDGQSDIWAQEMLNVPFDEESAPFHRRDFHEMQDHEHKQALNYYISFDLATSEDQKADYCAWIIAGINPEGIIYILDIVRQRMETPEQVETFFALGKRYDPQMFFVEKGQIWNMIKPIIYNKMATSGDFFIIEEFPVSIDKRSRTASIKPKMVANACRFDKKKDWWPEFEEECLRFRGKGNVHDDQVDALSLLGLGLQKFVEAPTPQEEAEEQYEEEKRESGFFDIGRSEYTGY